MIQCYGLFWHADKIFWGRQKNPGSLLGAASQSDAAVKVDFRDQRGIYALYSDYDLMYVGQAGSGTQSLFHRLRAHLSDHLSERWNRFSWFGTQWVTKQHVLSAKTAAVDGEIVKTLNILEAVAIAIAEPRLNLQRGRWSDATQYFQIGDERLDNKN